MFIIGIDPHKGSHTAAVIDRDEQLVGELSVCADRRQRDRLLCWAAPFEPRMWAVEGANGHGALLAQQLVASGETVVDVPAALSARARLLDAGRKDKTDAHDARSAAIVACYLIGYTGDVRRFATAGHYARYNATAPIEASSGPKVRHRLNPNGNRQLNHAIHIAALGQISHDSPGRVYYLAKQADGKSRKEAMRCLKRRISDAVYRQLRADSNR